MVICPEHAEHFAHANWKREQVGQYLYENARKPASSWAKSGLPSGPRPADGDEMISALDSPDAAVPVVIGGAGGAWSAVIPTWSLGAKSRAVTKVVRE